jgi:hypothetical protein
VPLACTLLFGLALAARAEAPPVFFEGRAGSFFVLSEVERPPAAEIAAGLAEAAAEAVRKVPFFASGATPPGGYFRVLVLRDRASFEAALRERGVEPPSDGSFLYLHSANPRERCAVGWLRAGAADLLLGLAHEACHARLRALVEEPPPWLNEGLAAALAGPDGAPFAPLAPRPLGPAPKATEVLSLGSEEFAARSPAAARTAARLVAALLFSPDPARREAIDRCLRALSPGAPEEENLARARKALAAALPGADLDALAAPAPKDSAREGD